jgi:hypothetical protein
LFNVHTPHCDELFPSYSLIFFSCTCSFKARPASSVRNVCHFPFSLITHLSDPNICFVIPKILITQHTPTKISVIIYCTYKFFEVPPLTDSNLAYNITIRNLFDYIFNIVTKYYIVASCCTFHSITISSPSYVQTLVSYTGSHLKIFETFKFIKSSQKHYMFRTICPSSGVKISGGNCCYYMCPFDAHICL